MISKNVIFCTSLAILVLAGCSKDYLDVNNDPNRVTDENITPELLFTQAEEAVGERQGSGDWGFLDNWMGYFSPNGDFAPNQVEQTYNIDFGFGDALWQRHYNVLFDLSQAKNKALSSGGDTVLAGASMVLSADLIQQLVDLYGDIPYSQAFQSTTYPNPKFDDAQGIYNSLLLSLDTAVLYLSHEVPNSFKSADIISSGNNAIWMQFANTLRLRLLIRQSEISGFNPSAEIAKIQNSGGILTADISVNPGYSNDVNKQSPLYSNLGYDPSGNKASTSTNANAYIVNILSTTADPRLGRFFQPVGSNYVGNPYGGAPGTIANGAGSSYFGPGLIGEDPGSGAGAGQDQFIYPLYEALFLKAEAIARGWMSGDAKTTYEDAVKASFVWLGVPDATTAATNYLNDPDNSVANWTYVASEGVDAQVNFIAFQKYIANCGVDPLESYSDERRLHFLPAGYISENPGKVASTLPLRLLYPQSEYTTNAASVNAVGDIKPYSTKIFWEP